MDARHPAAAGPKLHLLAGNGDQLYMDPFFRSRPELAALADATSTDPVVAFKWTDELLTYTSDYVSQRAAQFHIL
jgi:hypothetical protein